MYIFVCKCTSIFVNLLPSKFSTDAPICMMRSFFSHWQVQYESLTEAVRLLGCFSDAVDIQPLFDTNIQDDEVKGQGESLDAEVDLSRGVWEDFFWKSPENQWDFFYFCQIHWHYSEIGTFKNISLCFSWLWGGFCECFIEFECGFSIVHLCHYIWQIWWEKPSFATVGCNFDQVSIQYGSGHIWQVSH